MTNEYAYKLERDVEKMLNNGWELAGGVSVWYSNRAYYAQALVRK